jgi:hypothetical protein
VERHLVAILAAAPALACSGGVELAGDGATDRADAREAGTEDAADPGADDGADPGVDGPSDAPDGGPDDGGGPCAPQDARAIGPCGTELPGTVWDGAHCVPLGSGCACDGADCGAVYASLAGCVAARTGAPCRLRSPRGDRRPTCRSLPDGAT